MFDRLRMLVYRLKPARTVPDALKRIVVPKVVNRIASKVRTSDLIEALAKELLIDPDQLLDQVALQFQLESISSLRVPSPDLIKQVGHDIDQMRSRCILPQISKRRQAAYDLVVADPTTISIDEFRELGISVFIGLGCEIDLVWKQFSQGLQDIMQISEEQMFAVLAQLANDACALNASQVYISSAKGGSYEFLAKNERFHGRIHPEICTHIKRLLSGEIKISRAIKASTINRIDCAIFEEGEESKILLTWRVVQDKENLAEISVGSAVGSSEDMHQRLVLLIDDDQRFLFILTKVLESKNWKVLKEAMSTSALEKLKDQTYRPDLIICDVHMPSIDGPHFLRELKKAGLLIPTLILTSDDDQLLEAELAMLGANAFLRKQQDPRILLAWANNLTRGSSALRSI